MALDELQDGFGRHLEYLRLSVTDRCNFKCAYCLPDGCGQQASEQPLSVAEIGQAGAGVRRPRRLEGAADGGRAGP